MPPVVSCPRTLCCGCVTAGRALVVGGTGPTGIPIVRGLVDRGFRVTILHRGTHERPETPDVVEHRHADPFDEASLADGLGDDTWDVVVAMYGRLRRIAELTAGRAGRFVSVGGVPAYRGWMNPWLHEPAGLPVPVAETAPTVDLAEEDEKGYRIARTEEAVLGCHPGAAHFRYPYVYGPYQLVPREWLVVRRVLDGRTRMVVADDGLTLHHHGYTENLAHAVLLAVDRPGPAGVFNAGDEEVLTVRQVIEVIARSLGHPLELVSMPFDAAVPARPLLAQPLPTHRVLDLTRVEDRTRLPRPRSRPPGGGRDGPLAGRPSSGTGRGGGDRAHGPVRLRRRGPAHGCLAVVAGGAAGGDVVVDPRLRVGLQRPRRKAPVAADLRVVTATTGAVPRPTPRTATLPRRRAATRRPPRRRRPSGRR